jgi:hypothetical protein
VTPDSIPQPPPLVGSAESTPIYSPADLVTNQYVGRGMLFPTVPVWPGKFGTTAALTKLGGVDAWTPAFWKRGAPWAAEIDYGSETIQVVKPGTTTPTTVRSVTVEIVGAASDVGLIGLNARGGELGLTTTPVGTGSHGGVLLTLSGADISSFEISIVAHIAGFAADDAPAGPSGWGVAGVEFAPAPDTAPEPCGLALAGFGAAALAGWTWRLRRNMPAFAA